MDLEHPKQEGIIRILLSQLRIGYLPVGIRKKNQKKKKKYNKTSECTFFYLAVYCFVCFYCYFETSHMHQFYFIFSASRISQGEALEELKTGPDSIFWVFQKKSSWCLKIKASGSYKPECAKRNVKFTNQKVNSD